MAAQNSVFEPNICKDHIFLQKKWCKILRFVEKGQELQTSALQLCFLIHVVLQCKYASFQSSQMIWGENVRDIKTSNNSILVTSVVKALYTNIPNYEGKAVKETLNS